jgi:hypothetical protein
LKYRYNNNFSRFKEQPIVVFERFGDKPTARGLEHRLFEDMGGLKGTANRQRPV